MSVAISGRWPTSRSTIEAADVAQTMVGFCSTLLLRQARGTSVPPVGSEDLTWGMASSHESGKQARFVLYIRVTVEDRDDRPGSRFRKVAILVITGIQNCQVSQRGGLRDLACKARAPKRITPQSLRKENRKPDPQNCKHGGQTHEPPDPAFIRCGALGRWHGV